MAHVEDIAAGIALVGERGSIGESYVLGGELDDHGRAGPPRGGHRRPATAAAVDADLGAARGGADRAGRIGPDLGEIVSASAGVTYWGTDAKARRELGYAPRDLEAGLTAAFGS